MSFKSNFGIKIKEKNPKPIDPEAEFEQMLIKSGAKGSYMVVQNAMGSPNYLKIINDNTRAELIPKWIQNFSQNFWRFKDAKKLEKLKADLFRKRSILIGGGPSLEKNKHLLKDAKDYDIFCVDRSLPRINIKADFGVSVDAHPTVADYYKNANYNWAILPATCNPATLPDKRNFYYIPSIDQTRDEMMQLMTDLPVLVSQGNVNGLTCALAEWLEYEALVLVGYDFAYEITEKGITLETEDQTEDYSYWYQRFKATGASKETIKKAYTEIEHPVFKTKCLSDIMFDAYRVGFYEWLNRTKCIVTNSTEGGSLFGKKMECKKLEEVLNE